MPTIERVIVQRQNASIVSESKLKATSYEAKLISSRGSVAPVFVCANSGQHPKAANAPYEPDPDAPTRILAQQHYAQTLIQKMRAITQGLRTQMAYAQLVMEEQANRKRRHFSRMKVGD